MTETVVVEEQEVQEKAVVIQEYDVAGTALEVYGSRGMVRELMGRLMNLHPAAEEVGQPGMLAVAQMAILIGANPLPSTNEIHVWVDKGKVTVDLGINYFRRRSRELGGILWDYEPRIMTDQEYRQYGVDPSVEIAAICRACRISDLQVFLALGIPAELAFEQTLERRGRKGMGTVNVNAWPKKGRPLSWTALKAAEKDVCRALFPNLEQPSQEEQEAILSMVPHTEPGDEEWTGPTLNGAEAENLAGLREATARAKEVMHDLSPEERRVKFEDNRRAMGQPPEDFEGYDTPPAPPQADEEIEEEEAAPPPDNGNGNAPAGALEINNPQALLEAVKPLAHYKGLPHMLATINKVDGTKYRTWPVANPPFYSMALETLTAYANEQRELAEQDEAENGQAEMDLGA